MTKTNIIEPNELAISAAVPQCLDNQYIPDETFYYMANSGAGFSDPKVQEECERAVKREINRALIYSRQLIVDHSSFPRSRPFYSNFRNTEGNQPNRNAFLGLLDEKAIIPYLYKEKDIKTFPSVELEIDGINSFRSLLASISTIDCLRFSPNDKKNELETEKFQLHFTDYFTNFRARKEVLLRPIAEGLIPKDHIQRTEKIDALIKELVRWKRELSDVANEELDRTETVSRDFLYQKFICQSQPNAVSKGYFLSFDEDSFVLEKKKLIDLRYNVNLSDALKRLLLVPSGLPSRSALAIDIGLRNETEESEENLIGNSNKSIDFNNTNSWCLPPIALLGFQDIYEIRHLPHWNSLLETEEKIIIDPFRILEYFGLFIEALSIFNTELSLWYYKQKRIPLFTTDYIMRVAFRIGCAGNDIIWGSNFDELISLNKLIDELPESALGLSLLLEIKYYDKNSGKLDPSLSYSIDVTNYEREIDKKYLMKLIGKIDPTKNQASKRNRNNITRVTK